MSIYLCGNTGIVNRGCEAIVRSTNDLLFSKYNSIYLATYAPQQDNLMCKEIGVNLIQYRSLNIGQRLVAKTLKCIGNYTYTERIKQDSIISKLKKDDICLNIGGDTYCYSKPLSYMALNRFAKAKDALTILWCCSIENDIIKNSVKKDLVLYDYIFARDSITYNNLISNGIKANKVIKVCDPAFFLKKRKVDLPSIFNKGNVVGINLSECVIKGNDKTVYSAVLEFIQHLLNNTDLNICLIPHVYSIKDNTCDWPILVSLKKELNSDRVEIIDKELNCEELKYVISNCRFFVGARTHASIAAYSSGIPTLVLGYSVKSKGIAKDLFGDFENYVVPFDEIKSKEDIIKPFEFIVKNETSIKHRLDEFLPGYKNTLIDAINKYIHQDIDYSKICDKHLCSGCMACKAVCPNNAISIKRDFKDFVYPEIDINKCIKCNKCRNVCPSINKPIDSLIEPKCFGYINTNEDERKASTSGGAFIRIASFVINNKGVVYGVAYKDDYSVSFFRADDHDHLVKIQKSKYVQAEVGGVYNQVKADLDNGVLVLFSGCPCHIVALKRVLNKEYNNLITIDIICHGVPSPKAWQEYLDYISKQHNSKITDVSFKNKEDGWENNSSLRIQLANGNRVVNYLNKDRYFLGYIGHFYLRDSCYNCSARNLHRLSDFTLADFWGIKELDSTMFDDKGTSLIMVHTQKGCDILEKIKTDSLCKEYLFMDSIKHNPAYLYSGMPNVFSYQFYAVWKNKGLMIALDRFLNLPKHKLLYFFRSIRTWSK